MKIWRQGDVGITPYKKKFQKSSERILKNSQEKPDLVLAHGEVTGHAHRITQKDVKILLDGLVNKWSQDHDEMIIESKNKIEVTHEEHEGIVLKQGLNRVVIQREYDWASKKVRKVID